MSGAFRRFYLYSALSIAVLALASAVGALLALAFRQLGLGPVPTNENVRSTIAFSLAAAAVATPVGAGHLWLIRRGLRDRSEASSDVRHFYLNFWVVVALVVSLVAGETVATTLGPGTSALDRAGPLAAIVVSTLVALVAWRWRRTTDPLTPRWERLAAFVSMTLAMATAALQLANGVGATGQLWASSVEPGAPVRFGPPPEAFLQRTAIGGSVGAAWAVAIWAVGSVWQWPHRGVRVRLAYLVGAYAIGVVALLVAGAIELSALVHGAFGRGAVREIAGPIGGIAAGALLAGVHSGWLAADRAHSGERATFDRLLAAPIALTGLALLAFGAGEAWAFIVRHMVGLVGDPGTADPRDLGANVIGTLAIALIAYVPAWRTLIRRTEPGDPVRRFAVLTAMCLALGGGVITAAIALYSAIAFALGVLPGDAVAHAVAANVGYALIAATVFLLHMRLFLRDRRERPEEAPRDPLMETLEALRRGEISTVEAAARVRR